MVNILTSSQIPCEIREEVSGRVKPLSEVIGKGAVLADPVNRGAEYAVLQDEQPAQKQRKEKQRREEKREKGKEKKKRLNYQIKILQSGITLSQYTTYLLRSLRRG